MFSRIFHYLSIYREHIGPRIYIVFVLTMLAALTEGLGISLLLPLIETIDAGKSTLTGDKFLQGLHTFLSYMGIGDSMVGITLFIGVLFFGKGLLKFVEQGYKSYLQAELMKEIKGRMFDAYSSMDYRFYSENNTGHFINIITGQIRKLLRSFDNFTKFLSSIITACSYLFIAFLITWNFAMVAVIAGILLLFLFRSLNRYVHKLSRKTVEESSQLNKFLIQTLQAFKYITSTAQIKHLRNGVFESIKKLAHYMFRQGIAGSLTEAIREPVSVIFILGVIIFQVGVLDAPVAPIFVAIILFYRGMQSIIGIQTQWQKTMNEIGSLEIVVDEFNTVKKHQEENGSTKIGPLYSGIEFRKVSFAYSKEDGNVLKEINIRVPVNKTIAFVGESGAGKSTLIDMLTLLLRPTEGQIYIDGVSGADIDLYSWRSQIGYVSQETVVFDDTVANNISLWKGDYKKDPVAREEVHKAAQRAYAAHFIESLPDSYNTLVGERGVRLSGGQRQRLFIARELFKNPNLLILDEATSALDSESERYIQRSIDALKGSMTVVIIAHRLSTIKNTDYIYVLDEGVVVEQGAYQELLLKDNSRFSKMVEMQSL